MYIFGWVQICYLEFCVYVFMSFFLLLVAVGLIEYIFKLIFFSATGSGSVY